MKHQSRISLKYLKYWLDSNILSPHFSASMHEAQVAEIQGPYGPLAIPEQVVQQVWYERKFLCDRLKTLSGIQMEVLDPGVWNQGEGPDFRNARLRVGDDLVSGDVEIHFHARDWKQHGHDGDPEFNRVVLHVVLFPGAGEVRTHSGSVPETLVLLPHLETDLEQCLLEFRLARMESCGELPVAGQLAEHMGESLLGFLADASALRWSVKVGAVQKRLGGEGWEGACHQCVLEALGGRRNRAAFARIALEYPLAAMRGGRLSSEALFSSRAGEWRLAATRPASNPRTRLSQYLDLLRECPRWPQALRQLPIAMPSERFDPLQTQSFRKLHLREILECLRREAFPGLPVRLVDTLAVDVVLPLLSADRGWNLFAHWYHWHPGSFPDALVRFLRQQCAERGLRVPLGNGLQQGLLQLLNESRG